MTALRAVSAYLPERRVTIAELAEPLALTPSQVQVLQRIQGLREVRRQRDGESLVDLLAAAVGGLDGLAGREHLVRYVIYARGVPVATPFPVNPLHELCQRTGLAHANAFTVTHHACATSLLAVDLAGRLLAGDGDPDALALIVAGETVFTHDEELAPEARVFGEGAGACLVSSTEARDRLLSYVSRQRGDLDHWLPDRPDQAERFAKEYRAMVAEVVALAVEQAEVNLDDIVLMLPHNVNVRSWRGVCVQLGFPLERVLLENVSMVGHTFAADLFINHRTAVERGLLRPGDRYLVVAAGYGAVFSAMIFEH